MADFRLESCQSGRSLSSHLMGRPVEKTCLPVTLRSNSMNSIPLQARLAIVLLVGFGVVVWVLSGQNKDLAEVERIGFQGSDPPLLMPEGDGVDHRFEFPSAWEMTEIPLATRFDSPMGHLTYNAQGFWEMNEKRGGHHAGDDLNGIGGMNTDLGDPIYSVADGLVLYAGEPSSGWGNVLVIAHRTLDGRLLHSMYAHLDRIEVSQGALVARGQFIGTNGTGNDHYPAHLHFELRESEHVDIRGGYHANKLNLLDPMATLQELRGAPLKDHSPAPLALVMKQWKPSWNELEIEGAEHFLKTQSEN